MKRIHISALAIAVLSLSGLSHAQEHEHHHDKNEKLGKVTFRISCSAEAQSLFNRAVAWLHSFEYEEAERAFAEAAAKDPSCAMPHWGIAMSQYHQLWAAPSAAELRKGAAAMEKARSIGAKTERERGFISAIEKFYGNWETLDHQTRATAYEKAMEEVSRHYPNDREAAVFYALALNATALATVPADKTYARQKKAAGILNRVLREEPDHPGVTHYLIHSYDYPALASMALAAARSYSKIAPSSAHALHMPSHIFTRLGLWQEAIQSNIASEQAAKDYGLRNHLTGVWDEQLHAMDYLGYAYLQSGRDVEAKRVLDEMTSIRKVEPETFKVAYAFAALPARYTLERRRWAEAARLELQPGFPWNKFRWAEAITSFARAIGAARAGDAAGAQRNLDKLNEIKTALSQKKENYDWPTQIEIQRLAAEAWLARARGKNDDAVRLMRSAADLEDATEKHPVTPSPVLPAREMLGDLLLELKLHSAALREYEASLKNSPLRFNAVYGAARAAEQAGYRVKARTFYERLLAISQRADGDRMELRHAKEFLRRK